MEFALKYRKQIIILIFYIASLIGVATFTFFHSKDHWQAPLKKEIGEFVAGQEAFKRQIGTLQSTIQAQAILSEKQLKEKSAALDLIASRYEAEKKKEKIRVVYVKDPNTGNDVEVHFDPQNNLVCDRFQQTFVDTINSLVDGANK